MPKLIRDLIPDDMRGRGYEPSLAYVEGEELVDYLREKLIEEAGEASDTRGEDIKELADVMEAVYALGKLRGFTPGQIEAARQAKAERLGSFDAGTVWLNNGDRSPSAVAARTGYYEQEAARG